VLCAPRVSLLRRGFIVPPIFPEGDPTTISFSVRGRDARQSVLFLFGKLNTPLSSTQHPFNSPRSSRSFRRSGSLPLPAQYLPRQIDSLTPGTDLWVVTPRTLRLPVVPRGCVSRSVTSPVGLHLVFGSLSAFVVELHPPPRLTVLGDFRRSSLEAAPLAPSRWKGG